MPSVQDPNHPVLELEPNIWQLSVLDQIQDPPNQALREQMRATISTGAFNLSLGIRVNYGRRAGHTTLAAMILERFPEAIVVVPERQLGIIRRYAPMHTDRIIPARFPDTHEKFAIMSKSEGPWNEASICVVDNASMFTEWELAPLRSAYWDHYIELA